MDGSHPHGRVLHIRVPGRYLNPRVRERVVRSPSLAARSGVLLPGASQGPARLPTRDRTLPPRGNEEPR